MVTTDLSDLDGMGRSKSKKHFQRGCTGQYAGLSETKKDCLVKLK